jgi:GTP-binding protein Era
MTKSLSSSLAGVDGIVYMLDVGKKLPHEEIKDIQNFAKKHKTIVVLNKIDEIDMGKAFEIGESLKEIEGIEIFPISAMTGKNCDTLLDEMKKLLKDSERFYDEDMITDKSLRFMTAEIIREKALRYLEDEIPHGIGITITRHEKRENKDLTDIEADIICEKNSHKGIIIGKNGGMLKKIGTAAREDIEKLLDSKIFLKLFVKVREDWQDKKSILAELGLTE